jgi:hypothetical protein
MATFVANIPLHMAPKHPSASPEDKGEREKAIPVNN